MEHFKRDTILLEQQKKAQPNKTIGSIIFLKNQKENKTNVLGQGGRNHNREFVNCL